MNYAFGCARHAEVISLVHLGELTARESIARPRAQSLVHRESLSAYVRESEAGAAKTYD
jgi:hypothetical protein